MSERKYKILVIGPGGRHVENFIDRIKNDVEDITLVTDRACNIACVNKKIQLSFSLKNPINIFRTPRLISKLIQQEKPDVIHVHQLNSVALYSVLANRRHQVPLVVTAWGSDILINPERSSVLKRIVLFVLKRADAFTADAVEVKEKMQSLIPNKNLDITVCNFGVRETNIDLPKEKIIYSNRLHNKLYRIEYIIKAFAKFKVEHQDWKLIIAATGTETEQLKKLTETLQITDCTEFPGFVSSEVNNNYYASSSIYISIPESDATAISLLEAMYYKCIPVVSDLPANKEWIIDGKNGLIVDNVETEFISRAIPLLDAGIGEENRKIIEAEATESVSRVHFVNLHRRLIKRS